MKIVTWNLGYWQHQFCHDAAWAYLRNEIKPDLALLQEVSPPGLAKGECLLFKHVYRGWGTALYTRDVPLEELRVLGYPGHVAAAHLGVSGTGVGEIIAVSIHAPLKGDPKRVFPYLAEIFSEVETIVDKHTFIVGGDLNTARLAEEVWPGYGHGPFWEKLSNSIFFDCHQKFHDIEQQTIFRPHSKHPFQDDHLFTSHDLADKVMHCDVVDNPITRSLSDHIPVVAEIDL